MKRGVWLGSFGLLAGLFFFLPARELISFLDFKLFPAAAKIRHLRLLSDRSGRTIMLVGTMHYGHLNSEAYPLWDLKSVIADIRPDLVLVEIRPEAILQSHWGEGPIEMPFVALSAQEMGISADGMDDWSNDFNTREDKMVLNIRNKAAVARNVLVFTGYSHIPGLTRRLEEGGFKLKSLSEEQKRVIFSRNVEKRYPKNLAREYEKIAALVKHGETRYDNEWALRRTEFANTILSRGN